MSGDYILKLPPCAGRAFAVYLTFKPGISSVTNIDKATKFKTKEQAYKKYLSIYAFPEDFEKVITNGDVVTEHIKQPGLNFVSGS